MDTLAFTPEMKNDPVFLTNEAVRYLMSIVGYDLTYDQVTILRHPIVLLLISHLKLKCL